MPTVGRPRIFTDEERLVRNKESQARWRDDPVNREHKRAIGRAYKALTTTKERDREWYHKNKDAVNEHRRAKYRLAHPLPPVENENTSDEAPLLEDNVV